MSSKQDKPSTQQPNKPVKRQQDGGNKPKNGKTKNKSRPGPKQQPEQPKPQRERPANGKGQQPRQRKPRQPKQSDNNPTTQPQQKQQSMQGKQNNVQRKKPVATGPPYVTVDKQRYNIGPEFDSRNRLGWRKLAKRGSSVQFLFIPRMANRVHHTYYRSLSHKADSSVDTFAVGLFVQDSRMPVNALQTPQNIAPEDRERFIADLDSAFQAVLASVVESLRDNKSAPLIIAPPV